VLKAEEKISNFGISEIVKKHNGKILPAKYHNACLKNADVLRSMSCITISWPIPSIIGMATRLIIFE
jgi:hypothetical protein